MPSSSQRGAWLVAGVLLYSVDFLFYLIVNGDQSHGQQRAFIYVCKEVYDINHNKQIPQHADLLSACGSS